MIHIREGAESDAAALAVVLAQSGYPASPEAMATRLRRYLGEDRSRVFVADDGDRVVGVACGHVIPLLHEENNICRLTILAIAEDFRRRGVGRLLVKAVEEFGRECGCRRVEVTSGEHRAAAHKFYCALGYQEVSRRFVRPCEGPAAGRVTPLR